MHLNVESVLRLAASPVIRSLKCASKSTTILRRWRPLAHWSRLKSGRKTPASLGRSRSKLTALIGKARLMHFLPPCWLPQWSQSFWSGPQKARWGHRLSGRAMPLPATSCSMPCLWRCPITGNGQKRIIVFSVSLGRELGRRFELQANSRTACLHITHARRPISLKQIKASVGNGRIGVLPNWCDPRRPLPACRSWFSAMLAPERLRRQFSRILDPVVSCKTSASTWLWSDCRLLLSRSNKRWP